ncbi:MAG: Lin0512 family protein [Marinovum sp.]|nr:Lin0512 family protein [Marinovum sp.]
MMQRLIIQMAQGVDQTGLSMQRAAEKATKRALSQANLAAPELLGLSPDEMLTKITVGVPNPQDVDADALAAWNKVGPTDASVIEGGLLTRDPETGATQIVATAAAEIFLPKQSTWRLR